MNKTDWKVLAEISKDNPQVKEIAKAIQKSEKQVYRSIKTLQELNFLQSTRELSRNPFTNIIARQLKLNSHLPEILADSGIKLFTLLTVPKTTKELLRETKLKKSALYQKIQQAKFISLITKRNNHYLVPDFWHELKDFFRLFKEYSVDKRIPPEARIYYKEGLELIYSTDKPQPAVKTAFSRYGEFGIKLLLPEEYYFLPKKHLSIQKIFIHSLWVGEKEPESRLFTYIALFYLKNKSKLKHINHPILKNIKKILNGEKINNYPPLTEIKDKAKEYDILI